MLKYEEKLKRTDPDSLLFHAYKENLKLAGKNIHTWSYNIDYIKTTLESQQLHTCDAKSIDKILRERFQNKWMDRIFNDNRRKQNERNKLRSYRQFKNIYKKEKYLDCIMDFKTRSNFCRFRISSHNLMIEVGRHTNVDAIDRICKNCDANEIEDEKHALMRCSKHEQQRNSIFKSITELNKNFKSLDTESKFVWLLSNEDKQVILLVAKLINNILNLPRT